MLVEYVRGDFLNVVGFPLNHFCKKLAELYFPPRPEDLQRTKHDSIPAVDTFENLSDLGSDLEGGGSHPAPGQHGTQDEGRKGAVQSPHPSALLEMIDGFKASKVPP